MLEFFKNFYYKNLSRPEAAILILQFLTIFIIVYFFSGIFAPLIAALVLAFMLERPVSFLVKHGTSRLSASILVTLLYITVVASIFITIIPPAFSQLSKITQNISQAISVDHKITLPVSPENKTIVIDQANSTSENNQDNSIKTEDTSGNQEVPPLNTDDNAQKTENNSPKAENHPNSNSSKEETKENVAASHTDVTISLVMDKIEKLKEKLPATYHNLLSEDNIKEVAKYIKSQIKDWISPILTTQLAPFILDTVTILVYLIIVPIFSFYMLKDKDKLLKLSGHYLSSHKLVSNFWGEMNRQISQYLNGKCIHIVLISIINGIAFALFGLNYALLLGIGVGLSVLIPYVGSLIITVPVIIIGLMQFGFSSFLAWLLVVYIIIQLIDSYVITPMLFSETLNLDAFSILVAIVVFGGIWGIWGVILAIPLATFVKTIIQLWPTVDKPKENE